VGHAAADDRSFSRKHDAVGDPANPFLDLGILTRQQVRIPNTHLGQLKAESESRVAWHLRQFKHGLNPITWFVTPTMFPNGRNKAQFRPFDRASCTTNQPLTSPTR